MGLIFLSSMSITFIFLFFYLCVSVDFYDNGKTNYTKIVTGAVTIV